MRIANFGLQIADSRKLPKKEALTKAIQAAWRNTAPKRLLGK